MKRAPAYSPTAEQVFSLTNEGVRLRTTWRTMLWVAAWLLLSGFTMIPMVLSTQDNLHRFIVIGMSLVKYLPILMVTYSVAQKTAARYLDDIYELNDVDIASRFIEEIAFGEGYEMITIKDGKIPSSDEESPIILIGGPGAIHVHLDSVALLEKVNGEPEVIYPRNEPWSIGRFERIREIGKHDEVGKREYAIINLRDQFVTNLAVKARTKDGILIEAHDIKIIFSILRGQVEQDTESIRSEADLFDPRAVESLVYNQVMITPEPTTTSGISFPWDTTIIPLVITEMEELITSRSLSEILATIGQTELDETSLNDQTIAQMRVDVAGQQTQTTKEDTPKSEKKPPNFESRSKITAQFYGPEFKAKAANMGVALQWIDIGTWKLPSGIILEKHKEAWNLAKDNIRRKSAINKKQESFKQKEFNQLVKSVIFDNYDRLSTSRKNDREVDEFLKQYPFLQSAVKVEKSTNVNAATIALDMLKAFRKELVSAKTQIENDALDLEKKKVTLAQINKALYDVKYLTDHWIRGNDDAP